MEASRPKPSSRAPPGLATALPGAKSQSETHQWFRQEMPHISESQPKNPRDRQSRPLFRVSLGDIASRVAKAVKDGQWRRFRSRDVLDLLADAVELNRIKINDLKCPLRQQVQNTLDKRRKP